MSALCLNAVHNFHRAVHHQRGSRILNHLTEDPQNHLHVRAPAKRQFSHCQSLLRNRLLQLLEGLRGMGLPDNVCSRTPVHPFVTDACADESPTCKLLSTAASSVLRASLAQQHLQTLKHILGVRSTVNTHVLWQEVPVKRLEVVWLQRTVKFYNRLAAAPIGDLYRRIAIASCRSALSQNVRNWAWSLWRSLQGIGYTFQIRADDLDLVVEHTLDIKLQAKYNAVWQDLPFSPRTCPSQGASLCTYGAWFARPAHIHPKAIFRLPLSAGCVQALLRFRMGCHNLPWDLGRRQGIPRLHRVCTLCAGENPGDEQHVVFECPGLQDIRDRYQGLFSYHASIHVAR